MGSYYYVAIVTLLSCLTYAGMAMRVSRVHVQTGILPPAMTGSPLLERAVRAHTNTLEWMPVYLPSLWLFAIYCSPVWAAGLGAVWIIGRIIYFVGYQSAPEKRFAGFGIQAVAVFALLFGSLGRIAYLLLTKAAG